MVSGQLSMMATEVPVPSDERQPADADVTPLAAEAEATLQLLQRARAGDRSAVDALAARYLPRLKRWASADAFNVNNQQIPNSDNRFAANEASGSSLGAPGPLIDPRTLRIGLRFTF